ncbi:MAG TPA: hypothetical protein VFN90_07820 [Gemmatimonadales bacterium]|nr:hypothetical protein [Gemmatimonadales bacterium]
MSSKNTPIVKITLNKQQQEQVKQEIGKDAEAIELPVSELEERIVPRFFGI